MSFRYIKTFASEVELALTIDNMLDEEVGEYLGMDSEEVERLKVYGDIKRRAGKEFNQGWKPKAKE